MISREPGVGGALEHAEHRGRGARQCLRGGAATQIVREEQRRDGIARAVDRNRQSWRAHAEAAGRIGSHEIDRVGRRLVGVQRGDQHGARPEPVHRVDRRERVAPRRAPLPRQQVELELVRRHDVGGRHRTVAHQLRDARPHEHAAPDVADHRIAAVARARVRGLHLCHGIEDRGAGLGRAHVAGQHAIEARQRIARRDPLHHLGDQRGVEHAPGPGAVAGVVGELHGVDRPHLHADALQRKGGCRIADMAVDDVGLDREDVHAASRSARVRRRQMNLRDGSIAGIDPALTPDGTPPDARPQSRAAAAWCRRRSPAPAGSGCGTGSPRAARPGSAGRPAG